MLGVTGAGGEFFTGALAQNSNSAAMNRGLTRKAAIPAVDAQGAQFFGADRCLQLAVGIGCWLGYPGIADEDLATWKVVNRV